MQKLSFINRQLNLLFLVKLSPTIFDRNMILNDKLNDESVKFEAIYELNMFKWI